MDIQLVSYYGCKTRKTCIVGSQKESLGVTLHARASKIENRASGNVSRRTFEHPGTGGLRDGSCCNITDCEIRYSC